MGLERFTVIPACSCPESGKLVVWLNLVQEQAGMAIREYRAPGNQLPKSYKGMPGPAAEHPVS